MTAAVAALTVAAGVLIAAQHATLPDLAWTLDHNVRRYLHDFAQIAAHRAR
ncbi:hypothetical protein [Kitasatospora camelliae]|uniref:Uncharacterized protein n=1 Tax=Kitasatospora camelliae TaxID=3156397 RepID=A0AAU8JRT5_9ACTN